MNPALTHRHVMILTGEPSGDIHAAKVIHQLKKRNAGIYFSGIGGDALKKENVDLFFDIRFLSAMGITEVIAQFSRIKQAFSLFKEKLKANPPDLIILVDYPGFNLRAAQYVKKHYNIPILYYIAPKVWAWNKARLKKIRQFTDHVALIFPFENKIYTRAGINSSYVGNPLMEEYPDSGTKLFELENSDFKQRGRPLTIGLLPGSRKSEIEKLLPVMLKSAQLIKNHLHAVTFIVSKASFADTDHFDQILKLHGGNCEIEIHDGAVKNMFSKTDLLIAASGTVTLEAALACVPTILVYKMSELSYRLARFLVKLEFAGLANLVVNKEVMPELLQHNASPQTICDTALKMSSNLIFYQNQLARVRKFLGGAGASKATAAIAMQMMAQQNCCLKN